jgi:hemerythrin-like domain-containing protein
MQKHPTDLLENEHRAIQEVVAVMATLAEDMETGRPVDAEMLQDIVDFMRIFADKCHHGKEETHLFPALEAKGVPMRGCPVGALKAEHQQGRALVADFARLVQAYAAGSASAQESLAQTLRHLTELYPGHIWKEDYLLFPMANKILSPEDQATLHEHFEAVEEEIGRDVHHRFEQLAAELPERLQGS